MSYRVFWSPHAERRLEQIISVATDVTGVTAAAREIDRQLVEKAATFGESRFDTVRVGFVLPLGAQFEVHDGARRVAD